jgi:hypothetical protein
MTDQVVDKPIEPGSPEHDAAMAAKFDAAGGVVVEGGVPTQASKPDAAPEQPAPEPEPLLAGKFKSAADLEKAYKALEARLGAPKAEAAPTPAPAPTEAAPAPTEAPTSIDYTAVAAEVGDTGDISAATRATLSKQGLPDGVIDTVVRGLQAQANEVRQAAYDAIGGKENFDAIRTWAAENLSDAEKNFLQAQVNAGKEQAKLAMQTMKARFDSVNGSKPTLISGEKAASSLGYESKYQMVQDMKNPQYAKDSAFRAKVAQRIAATTAF